MHLIILNKMITPLEKERVEFDPSQEVNLISLLLN